MADLQRESWMITIGKAEHISDKSINIYSKLEYFDRDFVCHRIAGMRNKCEMRAYMDGLSE